jgi:hypothetical protein
MVFISDREIQRFIKKILLKIESKKNSQIEILLKIKS